jgi:hypothetical protein
VTRHSFTATELFDHYQCINSDFVAETLGPYDRGTFYILIW